MSRIAVFRIQNITRIPQYIQPCRVKLIRKPPGNLEDLSYYLSIVIGSNRVGPSRRSFAYVIAPENDILVSISFLAMI